jgi:hypothetical protein
MANAITFVNLTDTPISLETIHGEQIRLPALDKRVRPPKVPNQIVKANTIGGMPFEVRFKREVRNLPPPVEGTVYLVTGMISEVAERDDVLTVSETGALWHPKEDRIVAYRKLVRYTRLITERP